MSGLCPQRVAVVAATTDTKSRAGRRGLGLPDELIKLLHQHREEQATERETAANLWHEGGWVFTTPTGDQLNPRTDYTEWTRLLKAVGLRDGRLHDARHTAATVLLLLNINERAAMGLMGWSSSSMTRRYQHITDNLRRTIAAQVGGLIWTQATEPNETKTETNAHVEIEKRATA